MRERGLGKETLKKRKIEAIKLSKKDQTELASQLYKLNERALGVNWRGRGGIKKS
jgi:hypothetical protein